MRLKADYPITVAAGVLIFVATGSLTAQTVANPARESENRAAPPGSAPDQVTPPAVNRAHNNTYVIGDDDLLEINVWKEPDLCRTIPVRSDGRISLPLVGEMQAAGRTPGATGR